MKPKSFIKKLPMLSLVATAALLLATPMNSQAVLVAMVDSQVTVDPVVPTAANVTTSVYDSDATVTSTPANTRYSAVFRLWDTALESYVAITSISSPVSFQLGATNPAATFNVNFGGTFAAVGGGTPQFSLQDGANVDLTSAVYGLPILSTAFPSGVMSVTITNMPIPAGFAGGAYAVTATNTQSGTFTATLNGVTGSASGSDTSTVSFAPVPEPGTSLLLATLVGMTVFTRRRPATA